MRAVTWVKMLSGGAAMCIGGPALVWYVTPTEEQLVARYNPELRKRSLESRKEKQEDFDQFVTKLKQYSKSEKPIWEVWEQEAEKQRHAAFQARVDANQAAELAAQRRKDEIRGSIK